MSPTLKPVDANPTTEEPTLPSIGGVKLTPVHIQTYRLTLLLWGLSGCGKTTWLQTMPSPIMWINFDDSGTASLERNPHLLVADFSKEPNTVVKKFQKYGDGAISDIDRILAANTDIQSVVFDSITTYADRSVQYAVHDFKAPGAVFDNPGRAAYGARNRNVLGVVQNLMMVTGKHNRHFALVAHEDHPTQDDKGVITNISLLLGGSTVTEIPIKFSEIWLLRDMGNKKRNLVIRNAGIYRPMRSRMFDTSSRIELDLKYDPKTGEGHRIDDMYDKWKANNFAKINLPT